MKEVTFLQKNKVKWERFDRALEGGQALKPDELSELFLHITDDLAYSKTYYPGTNTTAYLNMLAKKAHLLIYRNKQVKHNRMVTFWTKDYPLLVYSSRKEIGYSFMVFIAAVLIGVVSTLYDPGFERIIMGDAYINQTLENIKKGDPLAVYKSMNQAEMFLGISINNIYVSFLVFVFGVFTSIGSGLYLIKNGIMLGAFQTFIAGKGYLLDSIATIWIHGTLEIFAIIVAGAAGIILGNSIVFPGSFTRLESFKRGAMRGTKLVFGLIPVFVLAAFLEGFVTRYTSAPYVLRFSIILASVLFIVLYFILYPKHIYLKTINHGKYYN
ncbi:MAG: stage II sporulation protein M [Bacteroidales bacterium]|nr:stage II sporulation protein M [Bacteroidales bacterium]